MPDANVSNSFLLENSENIRLPPPKKKKNNVLVGFQAPFQLEVFGVHLYIRVVWRRNHFVVCDLREVIRTSFRLHDLENVSEDIRESEKARIGGA